MSDNPSDSAGSGGESPWARPTGSRDASDGSAAPDEAPDAAPPVAADVTPPASRGVGSGGSATSWPTAAGGFPSAAGTSGYATASGAAGGFPSAPGAAGGFFAPPRLAGGPADVAGTPGWRPTSTSSETLTGPGGGGDGQRRTLLGFGIAAGVTLVLGLVVVIVLASTGFFASPERPFPLAGDPEPARPPLAELCPPPSGAPSPNGPAGPPVPGPRVVDPDAGISYLRLDAPFLPWDQGTWGSGTLGVRFRTGYYLVTETYVGGEYLASVLSGKVPATVGDSLTLNLECAGRQVAEDVRRAYYPQPNVKRQVRDQRVMLGGRPAWVSTFHLEFSAEGLQARGEQVAVVLVDVGRPAAAVLYISIPDTHRQYDPQIDRIIASVAPA